ncbi:MAG TPA: penicillin-binding transpeptidase domain-containing protein [Terriglobales bacterium]|nr:penicillin-binding transpeptidase domain-containing protein [Terriglobales bacterium]
MADPANRNPLRKTRLVLRLALLSLLMAWLVSTGWASSSTRTTAKSPTSNKITESTQAQKRISRLRKSRRLKAGKVSRKRRARARRRHRRYYERFKTSSYAEDVAEGDITTGEDPIVRAAAIEALGNMNGTVVAIDPNTGRILAMVNQKLALSSGAMPCSTIKMAVGLAALNEKLVDKDTEVRLGRRWKMNLTRALAVSNNTYFEALGRQLGYEKVSHYAHQFGIGELAGYDLEGEHAGAFPAAEPPARLGGVARMCSFGEGIAITPLQLGALVAAIANGGTLYYVQHPQSEEEVLSFQPRIKRHLDIAPLIPELSVGLAAAVEYGTARTLHYNFSEEQVLGKTGTCSKDGTRFGWFASWANTQYGRVVTVVFLRGGRPTYGPKAAEIAGRIYRNLYEHSFFANRAGTTAEQPNGTRSTGASQ